MAFQTPKIVFLGLMLTPGCSCSEAPLVDAAVPDAGVVDAGVVDAGVSSPDASTTNDTGTDAAAFDAAPSTWINPTCVSVVGTPSVTFTSDEGRTLAATGPLNGVAYTFGLLALERPNTVIVAHNGNLYRSTDAGCRFRLVGPITALSRLEAAGEDRAYAWVDNDAPMHRIDGETITALRSPATNILGLGADRANPARLRVSDSQGLVFESDDAGESWTSRGVPAFGVDSLAYRVVFAPTNFDVVFAGAATAGLRRSIDGGETWSTPMGLPARFNAFNVVVSAADANYVWVQGLDLTDRDVRKIWLSTDGGIQFEAVATESAEVTLINGNLLAPHPSDPNILYFVFGTYFQGYGTDVYRYDHRTRAVTKTHNRFDEVSSISFSPLGMMYLGITSEDISQ